MDRNVRVILNNKEVYGFQGQKILDLCAECGVEIPTLCYDPHLSVHGGCSVCLVDVKGATVEVRLDPGPAGYGSTRIARGDDPLTPVALAGRAPAALRAADILPRRPR